jgi:peptidoglycan/xylan/chitin deacetylase (PgdA/CDA1 family)
LGLAAGAAAVAGAAACSSSPTAGGGPTTTTPRPAPAPPSTPASTASSSTPAPTGPATEVVRGTGGRPEVALTFHGAGALSIARQIHDALGAANAKATIMAVGTWLAASPDGIRMFHDSGHEVGNHTWSHGDMATMNTSTTLTEIERCRDRLAALVGTPGAFFRQSSAQYPTQQELVDAGQAGYRRVLSYDIDGLDWQDPGPAAIRKAVAAATAGSVVSLHLGHQGTVVALPQILTDLADRGLRPVTASQLLS